jgi:hypothetical protein
MTIDIRMQGDAADEELRSLYEWLLDEPEVRQAADLRLVAKEPQSGEMGSTLDMISMVTTSAIGLPGMIDVIRNWSVTRLRRPKITIQRGDLKATFTDIDPEAVIEILEKLCED